MSTVVRYTVQGHRIADGDDDSTLSSFVIPAKMVTLDDIRRHFPFYGRFHFRCAFPPDTPSFAWMDLLDSEEPVPSNGGTIFLKVLPIPNVPDERLHPDETNTIIEHTAASSSNRSAFADKFVDNLQNITKLDSEELREKVDKVSEDLKKTTAKVTRSIGKNLGKLWKSAGGLADTAFGAFGSKETTPSNAAMAQLCSLEMSFSSPFSKGFPEHETLLETLWTTIFPAKPFQDSSSLWKKIGFQREDPRLDLRGGGILSLKCLVYFSSEYKDKCADMVRSQAKQSPHTYPFGAVGVNITLLLGDLLKLRDRRFEATDAVFWGVFEDPKAFYELFCLTFRYLDHLWTSSKADRKQFSQIIGKTKAAVVSLMASGPSSLGQMMEIAHQQELLF